MIDGTVMHKRGIQRRMQVSKNIAHIIKKTFTTAENLIEAQSKRMTTSLRYAELDHKQRVRLKIGGMTDTNGK